MKLFSRIELDTCQANYLILYEQIWVTEGTDLVVEEKTLEKPAAAVTKTKLQTARSDSHYFCAYQKTIGNTYSFTTFDEKVKILVQLLKKIIVGSMFLFFLQLARMYQKFLTD